MTSKAQKSIKQFTAQLTLNEAQLTIDLRSPTEDYTLSTVLSNDQLPLNFMNIFDNVSDIFNFLKDAPASSLDIVGSTFKIMVKSVVRVREVVIELTRNQISRLEILERRIEKVQKGHQILSSNSGIQLQRETQRLLDDFTKKNIKPIMEQLKKLSDRVSAVENKTKMLETRARPATPANLFSNLSTDRQNLFSISRPAEQPKKYSSSQDKETGNEANQMTTLGEKADSEGSLNANRRTVDFLFDIDQNNKYLSDFFIVSKNHVTRKVENEELYMFSSTNSFPTTDRHCLRIRIDKITDGLMWVGLITEAKKQEQYIGQEKGIIQFSLQGKQVLIDGVKHSIQVPEFKDGQVISIEVELSSRKLRFYRNNKPTPIVKITIPESMAACRLFPYVQLINEGDSVTLL